jgi:hypothetical protein
MTVCSETPRAISTLEQIETRLRTLELLPGLPRTPSDAKVGATSTPTGQPAAGDGL